MLAPSRKNPTASALLRTLEKSPDMVGVISSFCAYEVVEQLQLGVYYKRAMESDYTFDEARKMNAGSFDKPMLQQAINRFSGFLKEHSRTLKRVDPEGLEFWAKAGTLASHTYLEAPDLCHVALAMGLGTSAFVTNDHQLHRALQAVGPRRLGLTPVLCGPKTEISSLRRILGISRKRATRKSDELQAQTIGRIANVFSLLTEGSTEPVSREHLKGRLDRIEKSVQRSAPRKRSKKR